MRGSKGVVWLSAVIYILIAVSIMVLVLQAGLPLIKNISERNAFNKVRDNMAAVDTHIQQIAAEGQGSQRVVPIEVVDGELRVEDQRLRWKLETESQIIEPQSRVELGNMVISSDVDVSAEEVGEYFILQNSRILVNFTKNGSAANFTSIDTSNIVRSIRFKETNEETSGTFTFFINDSRSTSGNGYTVLEDEGSSLTSAAVRAHINNSYMSYDLVMTLDSKADFFRTSVENFEWK